MKRCHKCKGRKLVGVKVDERVKVAGRTFTARIPATRCAGCGEQVFAGPDLEALDLSIAGELARHGNVSASAFGFMRRSLGVRAIDLAEMLDVTPETVSRWEHGRQPIDRGAAALLAAMVVDRIEGRTATLDRLKALLKPERMPRLVRLVPRSA